MVIQNLAPGRAASATGSGFELRAVARSILLFSLLGTAPLAWGASGCPEPVDSQDHPEKVAAAAAGLRVHVDPDTGELPDRPPAGETPEPVPEGTAAVEDVHVETRQDGTVVADIGDRYRVALHAQIVDGRLVTCHRPVSDVDRDPAAGMDGD